MNAYEERRQRRVERYHERADKARSDATRRFETADSLRPDCGQPILVGHHSEGAHRSRLRRADNHDRAGIAANDRADHYERRADAAESNRTISSDDPEASDKLGAKIAQAERRQDHMKAINAAHKRFLKDPASLDRSDLSDDAKAKIRAYVPAYSWEPHPFAPYELTNNGANIRRMKERLNDLAATEGQEAAEYEINGVRVVENVEENRLQIVFDCKPPAEVRQRLKANGFRWSRYAGAWQRQLNNGARHAAQRALAD